MSGYQDESRVAQDVRQEVIERDGNVCRGCGVYVEIPHVHHIIYKSQGGLNLPDNLISLDMRCHERVHANKPKWLPVLQQLTRTPGVNGLQLLRWYRETQCPAS